MAGYWLKLYTEILDDPKYYRLSDNAKLGMYELMLVAKKVGQDGSLPNIEDIEFYTRRPGAWWIPVLKELLDINFITDKEGGQKIRKFEDRQRALTNNEKQKYFREELHKSEFSCNQNVTDLSRKVTESKSKSTEIDADVEVDADADHGGGLQTLFTQLYPGLKPRNPSDWDAGFRELITNNVTPSVLGRAAAELANKGMKVISPGSLLRPCLMVMQREKKRVPDSSGQFKEYINH